MTGPAQRHIAGLILLLILPAAARYSARCSSSFVPRSPTGVVVSCLDAQLKLLHGCQIAIESFNDYDCAEEVRKLNIPCSWFPPHGDVTPQVYLDMFEDDRLVAAGKHFIQPCRNSPISDSTHVWRFLLLWDVLLLVRHEMCRGKVSSLMLLVRHAVTLPTGHASADLSSTDVPIFQGFWLHRPAHFEPSRYRLTR